MSAPHCNAWAGRLLIQSIAAVKPSTMDCLMLPTVVVTPFHIFVNAVVTDSQMPVTMLDVYKRQ